MAARSFPVGARSFRTSGDALWPNAETVAASSMEAAQISVFMGFSPVVSTPGDRVLICIEPETQRLGADERDEVALSLPGRRIRQRGDQVVVCLGAIQRTGPVLHGA